MKNYYKILQVDPEAELEVLNSAYRARVMQCHPDKYHTKLKRPMHEQMLDINEAYSVLQDPARRAAYDREWQSYSAAASPRLAKSGKREGWMTIVSVLGLGMVLTSLFRGRVPVQLLFVLVFGGWLFIRSRVPLRAAIRGLVIALSVMVALGSVWVAIPPLLKLGILLGIFYGLRRYAMKYRPSAPSSNIPASGQASS